MSSKKMSLSSISQQRGYYIKILMDRYNIQQEVAEDCFSDTLCTLLTKNKEQHLTKGYMITCVCNKTIDYLRKRKETIIPCIGVDLNIINIDNSNQYTYKAIRKYIYKTSRIRRNTLILKFRFKMKEREIATFYRISRNTVAGRIRWAQSDLRKLIKE